jgi:hypothetical protein
MRFTREELTRTARTYEAVFRRRLRELNVHILRLPRATSAVRNLLWRERLKRKPFKSSGQGVRDALLWESVLELCRREPGQIVLITGNVKDFGNDNRDELHPQLLEDLAIAGVEQSELHRTVAAFNNAEQRLGRSLAAVTADEYRPASEPHRDP